MFRRRPGEVNGQDGIPAVILVSRWSPLERPRHHGSRNRQDMDAGEDVRVHQAGRGEQAKAGAESGRSGRSWQQKLTTGGDGKV